MRPSLMRPTAPTLAAFTVLLLTAACSSSDSGTGSTTSAATSSGTAAQGCAEVAALETSVTDLAKVQPVPDGLDALQSAAADVKTKLTAAASAVSDTLKPSVDEVQTAFDQLETALQGVTSSNLAASATAIGTALVAVGSAATNLATTLAQECPGS